MGKEKNMSLAIVVILAYLVAALVVGVVGAVVYVTYDNSKHYSK